MSNFSLYSRTLVNGAESEGLSSFGSETEIESSKDKSRGFSRSLQSFLLSWYSSQHSDIVEIPDALVRSNSKDIEMNNKIVSKPMPSSFRVLGIEIGYWSRTSQYIFCASGVMFFLLLYGVLQEFVVMTKFKRSLGWFVTFLQLSGYGLCGFFQHNVVNMKNNERRIPVVYYVLFAILHVTMQGFTNVAMQYLNYPAKTLFKSSRVIVTMIFGGCFMGKRYNLNDYSVAAMIIIGLYLFVVSDAHTSPVFDKIGILYICLALCADAAILNIQEYCLNAYSAGHDELVYYTYLGSGLVAFCISVLCGECNCVCSYEPNVSAGELWPGIVFLHKSGSISMLLMFVCFCSVGFLGMSCVAALTKKFGALTSAITATFRKGLTLVLSYILFPSDKVVTMGHIAGASIFLGGLLLRSLQKGDHKHHRGSSSPRSSQLTTEDRWGYIHSGDADVPTQPFIPGVSLFSIAGITNLVTWLTSERYTSDTHEPVYAPFGMKSKNNEVDESGRRLVIVEGSLHCESVGDEVGAIGGFGVEIPTDSSDDEGSDSGV